MPAGADEEPRNWGYTEEATVGLAGFPFTRPSEAEAPTR
jgi:hypothetical protein